MSVLRQFGVTVLSWLKMNNPFKRKKEHRLRTALFLQPLAIIIGAFALLFVIFNVTVHYIIDHETEVAVESRFHFLNQLYVGEHPHDSGGDNLFQSTYLIMDNNENVTYVSNSIDDVSSTLDTEELLEYFQEHDDDWEIFDDDNHKNWFMDANTMAITLKGKTYHVMMDNYRGTMAEYYVKQTARPNQGQSYYIFVFVNTTPMQQFLRIINLTLLTLMLLVACCTWFFIYLMARKVDISFVHLKEYVVGLGQRKQELARPQLDYSEFNQVGQTVEAMNTMINRNQYSQKLFFQNASHELRTPLMSIQGYAEGIKEGVMDGSQAADVILAESLRMTDLVDDILSISKMEMIQGHFQFEPLDLKQLLHDTSWRLKSKIDERGLQMIHEFPQKHLELEGDEGLLERAFLNILANAVRYASSKIRVTGREAGANVVVEIANDGEMIAKEEQKHIFERFYKGRGGQHGIGLALAKEIIEGHSGSIAVDSDAKQTLFTVTLPKRGGDKS
ncbi:sensor histidine kinase [Streptococcus dentasini]